MPTTTEAYVVHEGNGPINLETVHYHDVGPREVLVETVAASLCHTDMVAASGVFHQKPPMILGHEAAGIGLSSTPFHSIPILNLLLTALFIYSQGNRQRSPLRKAG